MDYKIINSNPNYLLIKDGSAFEYGLLFPHNILFEGEEISIVFSLEILKRIKNNEIAIKENCSILSKFGENNQNAILLYDCKDDIEKLNQTVDFKKGEIYKGRVLGKSLNRVIVGINGHYGYFHYTSPVNLEDEIYVEVINPGKNVFTFSQFSLFDISGSSIESLDEETITLEKFLSKDELASINEADREIVEWILENIPGTTRKNLNVIKEDLHISYNPEVQVDLHSFLTDKGTSDYFQKNNFWVGVYKDNESNDIKLIFYDCNNIVIETHINEKGIWVSEFSRDKNISNAQYLIDKNQKALIISGSKLSFHEYRFILDNYLETANRIYNQFEVSKKILPNLNYEIKSIKEKAGLEYITLRNYLIYQENQEKELSKNNSISIFPNSVKITTSDTGSLSTGLHIPEDTGIGLLVSGGDGDTVYVEIITDEQVYKA